MLDWDDIFGFFITVFCVICLGAVLYFALCPEGVETKNEYEAMLKDVDYNTNYDSVRQIEETLRSYAASYEADRITYEINKDSTDKESIALAKAARSRANRTAATYNQFYLKNSYIWEDNIPADIQAELEYIQ